MTAEGDSDSDSDHPALASDHRALLIQRLRELYKEQAELAKFQRLLLRLQKYFERKLESKIKKMNRILESVPEDSRHLVLQAAEEIMAKNLSECVASDSSDSDSDSDEMDE